MEVEMEDKRNFPRLSASVEVGYTLLKDAADKKTTYTKNISAGGICLIVYEKIEPGSILALKLQLPDVQKTIEVQGKVVWTSHFTIDSDQRDRYDLGIEFNEIDESLRQRISQYVFKLK
jgi:c-di-GMP-binding flagellar brake protein YcgR